MIEKINKIRKYLEDLKNSLEKFWENDLFKHSAYFEYIQIIEEIKDIIQVYLEKKGIYPLDFYYNLNKLEELGEIDKSLKNGLIKLNILRNRIVHAYYNEITDEEAFKQIKENIRWIEKFLEWILKRI